MKLTKADKFFDGFFAFWGVLLVAAMVLATVKLMGDFVNDYPWTGPWFFVAATIIIACVVGCARTGGE